MDDGYEILASCTKKILSDDAHGNLQLIHIMTIIVRHQMIYFHVRYTLANLMIQSAQKIAGQQTNSIEQKKLAIDIIEVIIKWELRKHYEQINDQKNFNRPLIDTIFVFLIRHACQINIQNMIPLSQQCIRLFKIARKFAWPNVDVKLTTFERLIHQIVSIVGILGGFFIWIYAEKVFISTTVVSHLPQFVDVGANAGDTHF
jgi:hypothetical protein